MKDVEAAYDKVVAQIRNRCTHGYTSSNTAPDGEWRRKVRLSRRSWTGRTPAFSRAGATSPSKGDPPPESCVGGRPAARRRP